tara:strand:- start:3434 stop:3958 length:525 start_codon:yes stop_codon:yes gene_type:complete
MDSLAEYDITAKKILMTVAPSVALIIINDPDRFGYVVGEVMKADWKWNGNGTKYGYRKQRVIWAVKKILSSIKKNQKTLSLHQLVKDSSNTILDIVDNRHKSLVDEYDYVGFIRKKVENSSVLSIREKECIISYCFDDASLRDTGTKLGIHRESVRQNVRRGLRKLGMTNGNKK